MEAYDAQIEQFRQRVGRRRFTANSISTIAFLETPARRLCGKVFVTTGNA
jgi:hypothetical protein